MSWKRPPEYIAYGNMLSRCYNHKNSQYHDYGGRGIKVCDRWIGGSGDLSGYHCFLADLGSRPSPKHSLDRVDNDGDYGPENCRWALWSDQRRNMRVNHWVVYHGQRMTMEDATAAAGYVVTTGAVSSRLKRGWTIEQAVETPSRQLPR